MATKIDKISLFLPTYNEEGNIEKVVLKAKEALIKNFKEWEILIINDGSSDSTPQVVSNMERLDSRIKLINHEKNMGYGSSLQTGFYNSKYPWISFIDSDGQFDFNEISTFVDKQSDTDADLVIGFYKKRRVSFAKIVTSKIWELFVFVLFGLKVKDIDCGFKLISKKVIDSIPHLESERGAFISSELLIKSKKKGFKIVEVPVTHYPRTRGEGTGRKLNVIIKSFIDLFRLWKKLN